VVENAKKCRLHPTYPYIFMQDRVAALRNIV